MEQEGKELAGVTRGQNVVYQLPHDWSSVAQVLAPVLDRLDEGSPELQLVIVTADGESAASAAAAVMRLAGNRALVANAATSARRVAPLLRVRPAHVVSGTAGELLTLVQGSVLKLDHVRTVVLAWVDEVLAGGDASPLESLMAEMPKEAARALLASEITPGVEALIERYARRARRVAPTSEEGGAGSRVEYVTVSGVSRLPTLRRLLDDLEPMRAVVYVRSDESERDAADLLRALGYDATGNTSTVRVARAVGEEGAEVVVLYDIPASREELREAIGARPVRVIALAQPRQLASLRLLGGSAPAVPFTLSDAGARARAREEQLRAELRDALDGGAFSRELLTLEPLLERYDGIEIAAAALRLLQQTRIERDAVRARPVERSAGAIAGGVAMPRLFLNIGSIDHAKPGDLVGAITNEAGITSAQIGKIDIRENHSLVEVASDVIDVVAAKLTGTVVRGRRLIARIDQERPGRGAGGPPRGRSGDRGSSGERFERGRSDRGARGERGERGNRSDRGPHREGGGGGGRSGGFRERGGGGRPSGRRPGNGTSSDRAARPPRPGEEE